MSESSDAEQLIGVLINKMESMDSNLSILKAENDALKRLINNPQQLLRKMGLSKFKILFQMCFCFLVDLLSFCAKN